MFQILKKVILNPQVTLMNVHAPHIAKKALPGQFIILRVHEDGERIPLTIADYNRTEGFVTIIFQTVGKTTNLLNMLNVGDSILDFAGPLGVSSHFDNIKKVAVIGGGLGTAIAYPQAKHLFNTGAEVHVITGFRNKDLIILEEELKQVSHKLIIATDDGSNGKKGLVTDILKSLVEEGNNYDLVIAIGPLIMMKFVSLLTKQLGIKTVVSMNPVMIDGTGMCGGCRLTVGGKIRFACIDGPDFDGHEVDFDEAIRRAGMYKKEETLSAQSHTCNLRGEKNV